MCSIYDTHTNIGTFVQKTRLHVIGCDGNNNKKTTGNYTTMKLDANTHTHYYYLGKKILTE